MKDHDSTNSEDILLPNEGSPTSEDPKRAPGVSSASPLLPQVLGQIGGRIHHYRKAQKMSQEKLAQGSCLDRAYISSVENGKQNITIGALLKLSDALGVELADLVNGSKEGN